MRVLLIRHAEAVEKAAFGGPDEARPLTAHGLEDAARVGAALARLYGAVAQVVTSPAVRAVQTAEAVASACGAALAQDPRLAPGCGFEQFREIVREWRREEGVVALVGHEPDLSAIVTAAVGAGAGSLKLGKASVVELEVRAGGRAELRALLPFAVLSELARETK